MKNQVLVVSLILFITLAPVIVFADNIRVTPVGELHTGMAIITGSPANLETNSTNGKTINEVWLIFIVDGDTYTSLNTITITGTEGPNTLDKNDFSDPVSSGRIPQASDTNYKLPQTYPGCKTPQTNYQVSAILSQMAQVHTKPTSVRYVLVFAFSSVDGTPKPFTVTVDSTHINVLILAQGKDGETTVLNENSPFSGSSLVIPEPATVLAALASFAAFAIYAGKRRKLF
jgi:hypothetical protein